MAFTKMHAVISGWAAGAAVLIGSMNALGSFKHYRHNPDDPNSLISDNVYTSMEIEAATYGWASSTV